MDYKKEYEQLTKFIKDLHPFMSNYCKEKIERMLPELKESEDERIRKELISHLISFNNGHYKKPSEDTIDSWIAWLEKQGEQKTDKCEGCNNFKLCITCTNGEQWAHITEHTDKIEPKFHEGDWIVFNGFTLFVKEVVKGYYRTISNCEIVNSYDWNIDNIARLWTIKDAKDGDVLVASDGSIFLFAGVDDCACKYYAALTNDNNIKINKEVKGGYWETSRAVYPAAKEQCESLFQKMKEEGYEWDGEKRELRKL